MTDGSNSDGWGIYAYQSFDNLNLEAYAGWRSYSYEDDLPGGYKDASSVLVGARWRF